MELDKSLQKAEFLLNNERYTDAQKEVKIYLSSNPNSTSALSILAQSYLGMGQYKQAHDVINSLMSLAPDNPVVLYFKAVCLVNLGKRKDALRFAEEALSFDPMFKEVHALKSAIYFQQAEFDKALESANAGLHIDPEDETCLNNRSRALLKLGRTEEHLEADRQALKSNPMNADTHASVGYSELQKGNSSEAKKYFREALRLDPNNEFARSGMLEAIKSTNLYYRLFLKYVFWMQSLKPGVRWAVVVIGYLLIRFLGSIKSELGDFQPIASVVITIYLVFAISTWVIGPISNVFLRFHSFGKYILLDQEKKVANICAALLLLVVAGCIVLFSASNGDFKMYNLGYYLAGTGIALMIIISSIESASLPKSKRNLQIVGAVFASGCAILLVLAFVQPILALKVFNWLVYGFIGYQFFANSQE